MSSLFNVALGSPEARRKTAQLVAQKTAALWIGFFGMLVMAVGGIILLFNSFGCDLSSANLSQACIHWTIAGWSTFGFGAILFVTGIVMLVSAAVQNANRLLASSNSAPLLEQQQQQAWVNARPLQNLPPYAQQYPQQYAQQLPMSAQFAQQSPYNMLGLQRAQLVNPTLGG